MITERDKSFLRQAVQLAVEGITAGKGGPFGCIIVKDGQIVGMGANMVTSTNDPTAHAEIVAIRDACNNLGNHQLTGCDLYASCEPCPMCLGAIYWARPNRVFYAATRYQAADAGFDDDFIYRQINLDLDQRHIPFHHLPDDHSMKPFHLWSEQEKKQLY